MVRVISPKGRSGSRLVISVLFSHHYKGSEETSSFNNCNFSLYADDSLFYSHADSIHNVTLNLQISFEQKHPFHLKLVLNCAKTKWILFQMQEILTVVVLNFVLLIIPQ